MDEQKNEFTLTLKGKGINVENTVDQKTALTVLSIIWGDTPAMVPSVAPEVETPEVGRKRVSMGEYIDETGASTNKERIVAIGLYLSEYKDSDTFSRDDVVAGFRSAREPMPKNLTRDLSSTAEARWIEEADESGTYYVTSTGAKAAAAKFSGQDSAKASSKKASTGPRGKTRADKASDENEPKGKKPKSSTGGHRAAVEGWISNGFFDEARTIADLVDRFHESAILVKQTSLSPLLVRLVRDGLLVRKKQEVGGKQLWTYSKA